MKLTTISHLIIAILLFITYVFPVTGHAQISQGELTIGGANADYAYSIVQTKDGGFALGGKTNSYGAGFYDFYAVKLDSTGNLQWGKAYGGSNYDYGYSIIQTSDGGFAMTGVTDSYASGGTADDYYVVKTDASGNTQWTRSIGGTSAEDPYSIIQTKDGGYAIAGYTASYGTGQDGYIVKLDASGNKQWTKSFIWVTYVYPHCIIQTKDGGYAVAGTDWYTLTSHYDAFLSKFDSLGNPKWTTTPGGALDDYGNSVVQTADGGYALTGTTNSSGAGSNDVLAVKMDSLGKIQWNVTIGGKGSDGGSSITATKDGGYAIAGVTASYGAGSNDVYIVKLSSTGGLQWTRTIGGTGDDEGEGIVQTRDGGYAIGGYTNSFGDGGYDTYFIKLDSAGNFCSNAVKDSGIIKTGPTGGSGGGPGQTSSDSGRVKSGVLVSSGGTLMSKCNVPTVTNELKPIINSAIVLPNPNSGRFTIEVNGYRREAVIEIYNITGEKIYSSSLKQVQEDNPVNLSNQPAGIYLYRILDSTRNQLFSGKLVIQ